MMKKNISACYIIIISLFFIFSSSSGNQKKELRIDSLENKSEIIFTFPSFFESKLTENYVNVITKRLTFLSKSPVNVEIKDRTVVFSFRKGNLTDEEIFLLNTELLENFEMKFYDVITKKDSFTKFVLRPNNYDNIGKGKSLNLIATFPEPFLVISHRDLSKFYLDKMKINGNDKFVLRFELNEDNLVLEEKTEKLSADGKGMMYYAINHGNSGVVYVRWKLENKFTINIEYEEDGRIMEMKYRYPLPESTTPQKLK